MIEFSWDEYVDDVLSGRIPAGRFTRLACERHVRDLETGSERGLYFDEDAARVVISFFYVLRHYKGEWGGAPIVLAPPQQFWIASIFGWKMADGTRRFRTAYLEVPRKNGKTLLAAVVGLYLAFVEGENGAEVYSAATKRDQAKICHNDATQLVKRSPQMKRTVGTFRDNLHQETTASKFEPLSSDHNTLDGLNPNGAICDELHAWKSPDLWGVLKTGMGARRQPLMLAITTAGTNQQGICFQQREYVSRILTGDIEDDRFWGMIYTIDRKTDFPDLEDDDDWQSEENWRKANPLLGISKKWETMRQDAREAANKPLELNQFLRWHLDIWTQASTRWISPTHWSQCGTVEVDEDALEGRPCYAGLDLAQIYDLAALVLTFPPESEGEPYKWIVRFWLPEDNMVERVRRDHVPYDVWARLGSISLTPGNVIDYDFIEAEVLALAERYRIIELAYDRYGASQIMQNLQDAHGDDWVVPTGQGFVSMSPPMKELGRLITSGGLAHGNDPVLNWMAGNVVAIEDAAGNIKPDKSKSREKIDGIVAGIMSLDRAIRSSGGSVYEERGLLVL